MKNLKICIVQEHCFISMDPSVALVTLFGEHCLYDTIGAFEECETAHACPIHVVPEGYTHITQIAQRTRGYPGTHGLSHLNIYLIFRHILNSKVYES